MSFLDKMESAAKDAAELVNIGVTGLGLIKRPPVPELRAGGIDAGGALKDRTRIHVGRSQETADCPIYARELMLAGNTIAGPAIVEQYDSTTVIPPGLRAVVDRSGNIVIDVGASAQARAVARSVVAPTSEGA